VNAIFISPQFPPQFWLFCRALRAEGITVLGLGDSPHHDVGPEVLGTLTEYAYVPRLGRYASGGYDDALRAVAGLIARHGRIDRIDSLNEYWLPLEAQLREDFNVPGPRPAELARHRSKTGMREIFRAASVPCTEGEALASREQVLAFAARHGWPLVLKPDVGVGAAGTFKVDGEEALDEALRRTGPGYLVEAFVHGPLCTYDGLTDRGGRIVYETSHVYSSGVMEVVNAGLDMFYYSLREIPAELADLGRRVVKAFGLQERFFHIEWFDEGGGKFRALEINLRPPGGFTTDMMNYGADIDVYALWAKVIAGRDLSLFRYERRYFTAHAARRRARRYRVPAETLPQRLGARLVVDKAMPPVLAGAMGDHMYLLRSPDRKELLDAIQLVLEPG